MEYTLSNVCQHKTESSYTILQKNRLISSNIYASLIAYFIENPQHKFPHNQNFSNVLKSPSNYNISHTPGYLTIRKLN